MNDPHRISFTEKLDAWARRRFSIGSTVKRVTHLNRSGCVECRRDLACDLYLRLWQPAFRPEDGYWPAKTLVIARMEFDNTRSGHGRGLLDFLVQHADAYGYKQIALEHSHNGDDIQGFARKFGFEYAWPNQDPPQRNWIAPIDRVVERLDQTVASS